MGRPVQRVSRQANTVTVDLGDATADRYDLVIGADGIHSTVRHLTVGDGAVRSAGRLAWRFVTECPPEVTTWTAMLDRHVTFLAMPIGRDHAYCYCETPTQHTPGLQGDDVKGRLAELLTGFAAPVSAILDTLGADGAVHVAPIEEVTLHRWSQGSVVLVGDAAHATSPNMAEGAAMALEDGLVLAECVASGRAIAQAVARFQARRRPRTQWVLAQTHRRDRTRNLQPTLRNTTSNAYKGAFKRRRAILPGDGFYEWKKLPGGKRKQPYYLERRDGDPIALVGLWEEWGGPDRKGEPLCTVTIITTDPNETMAPIHDRMPVILPPSAWDAWLDPTNDDTEALAKLLVPAPAELLVGPPCFHRGQQHAQRRPRAHRRGDRGSAGRVTAGRHAIPPPADTGGGRCSTSVCSIHGVVVTNTVRLMSR